MSDEEQEKRQVPRMYRSMWPDGAGPRIIAAAHALLRFDPSDGDRLYERAAALLSRAIVRESARTADEQLSGLLAEAYIELGMCHELRGDTNAAQGAYSDALRADPESDAALTARGLLLMSTDEGAAEQDFERAVQTGTPIVWPYLFLAPMYLRRREYRRCITTCRAGLRFAEDDEQRAQFVEWSTMAEAARQAQRPRGDDLFAQATERPSRRAEENRRRERALEVASRTSLDEARRRLRRAIARQPLPLPDAA